MERMNYQEIWERVVDKGFDNYKKLTREERVWFNVEPITTGGIWDHYMNGGGEHNVDLMEDFIYLGFPQIAKLFQKLNELFPKNILGNLDEISACIESWPDGKYDNFLDEIDDEFWEISESVERKLLEHISTNFPLENI